MFFVKLFYFSRGEKKNRRMDGIDRTEEATQYFRIRCVFSVGLAVEWFKFLMKSCAGLAGISRGMNGWDV